MLFFPTSPIYYVWVIFVSSRLDRNTDITQHNTFVIVFVNENLNLNFQRP